jgi:glycosidase
MRSVPWLFLSVWLSFICGTAPAGVRFSTLDAVVWGRQQTVVGRVDSTMARAGVLLVNGVAHPFQIAAPADSFAVTVMLGEGLNRLVAQCDSAGSSLFSDTLRLTLGYNLRPEVYAFATGGGSGFRLHASVLENPDSSVLTFSWSADPRNPSASTFANPADSGTAVSFSGAPAHGEYLFVLRTITSAGDTVTSRAALRSDSSGVHPFDIANDHFHWIDSAVVYGIMPSIFVMEGRFRDILPKIPDLVRLGVTTLWLQPVYATHGRGQGYDVTDFFAVRSDLGTETELQSLVDAAHAQGLRVLFDFVPNHSSIYHPYAVHSTTYGPASHYWSFYQRAFDGSPYSQHYKSYGGFVNYFWNELPNLNYDNAEVRRMITEAGKYWVERFGIDGYRVDVAWGVSARAPEFFQQFRLALKRVRPDLMLLGEDKATWPSVFEQRFDVAYDWAPEQSWVSHWTWQPTYSSSSNPTIFNNVNQNQRAALLRSALTNNGSGYSERTKVLHFMENNDTFRFLATHDLARTRMVASMMFSVGGVPLLFTGQEIGASVHPYSAFSIFSPAKSIPSQDTYGLFTHYSLLAGMRKRFAALTSTNFAEVPASPNDVVFAYRRWEGRQNVLAVMNMSNYAVTAYLTVPVASLQLDSSRTYYLTDQITNQVIVVRTSGMSPLPVTMPAFTTKVFVLDTTAVTSVGVEETMAEVPSETALLQNYPNPFNPATTLSFTLAHSSMVRLVVYDVIGRDVATLVNGRMEAGRHVAEFSGRDLATGVYFARLDADGRVFSSKMMLLK